VDRRWGFTWEGVNVKNDMAWKSLSDVMNAFIRTEVLTAACELKLFDHLQKWPGSTIAEVARHFHATPRGIRILMLGCQQAGLVIELRSGQYANTAVATRFLITDSPECMLNFVAFVRGVQQRSCHSFLKSLISGEPVGLLELGGRSGETLYELISRGGDAERSFHAAMNEYSRIAEPPPISELDKRRHLLDIGGGVGGVADKLCHVHPLLRCTILELPTIASRVVERIRMAEISNRIDVVPCDVLNAPWPGDCDAILFSHFLEIFDAKVVKELYKKASNYLHDDGIVVTWTLTPEADGEITLQAVKSSVYFLTTAGGNGMTYSIEEHERWIREAGLDLIRIETQASTSHSMILARKNAR